MNSRFTVEKTAEKYGLFTAIGLIALFFLMKVIGVVHVIELRVLNVFVLAVPESLWRYDILARAKPESFTYLKGLGLVCLLESSLPSCLGYLYLFIPIFWIPISCRQW